MKKTKIANTQTRFREHSPIIPILYVRILCPKFSTCIYDTDQNVRYISPLIFWKERKQHSNLIFRFLCSKRQLTINGCVLSREDLIINKLSLRLVPSSSSGVWAQRCPLDQHVVGCRLLLPLSIRVHTVRWQNTFILRLTAFANTYRILGKVITNVRHELSTRSICYPIHDSIITRGVWPFCLPSPLEACLCRPKTTTESDGFVR